MIFIGSQILFLVPVSSHSLHRPPTAVFRLILLCLDSNKLWTPKLLEYLRRREKKFWLFQIALMKLLFFTILQSSLSRPDCSNSYNSVTLPSPSLGSNFEHHDMCWR